MVHWWRARIAATYSALRGHTHTIIRVHPLTMYMCVLSMFIHLRVFSILFCIISIIVLHVLCVSVCVHSAGKEFYETIFFVSISQFSCDIADPSASIRFGGHTRVYYSVECVFFKVYIFFSFNVCTKLIYLHEK